MAKLIKADGDLVIKKPENLVKARYKLSPLAIKFLSTIIANLRRSDEINEEYILRVADFKELTGQKTKRIYELIEEALEDLLKNPLKIPLNKEHTKFLMTNWVSSAVYDTGQVSFMIDKRLKPFLIEIKEKFLKYRLENILSLRSSYSIRFYEILKDWLEMYSRYGNKAEKIIKLDDFREILEIPRSYKYGMLKKRILEKAKAELTEHTDIIFDYEEIKTGRKVTHLKFIIHPNPAKLSQTENRIQQVENNFNTFRQELIKNNAIITLKDKHYEIKDGYLWQDDKLLNKEEAFEAWQELYKNKDQIKIIEDRQQFEAEREENRKEQLKQELLRAYFGKKYEYYTKNALGGDELLYYEILKIEDITFKEDGTIDLITFIGEGEDGKHYRLKVTLNQLKQNTK